MTQKTQSMKRYNYFMAVAAVFAVTACAEKENFESVNDTLNEEKTSLCAVMEDITKATVDQNGRTSWIEGDQVAVYTSASKFETLTLESMTEGVAKFTGVVDGTINSGDVVVYPAAAAKSYASEKLTVTFGALASGGPRCTVMFCGTKGITVGIECLL